MTAWIGARRRTFVKGVAGALGCLAAGVRAQPEDDTGRQLADAPFTLIAPFPPGGPVDTLARILSRGLNRIHGKPAVVENLPGAAGNIGMDKVRRAKPDGHTLLVVPAGNLTINPTLMPEFPFRVEQDFTPITLLATAPNVLVAAPSSGIRDVKALIARAQAKPDALSFASPGVGSGLHLVGELFKQQTGIELLHVPYKGTSPALNDVVGGAVPLMFSNLPGALPFIRDGKLLALGITDTQRTPIAPGIPTLAEQGIDGVAVKSWYGLLGPGGLPPPIAARLARDAAAILGDADNGQLLEAQGMTTTVSTPAEFAAAMREETAVWLKVIRSRHIRMTNAP
ncbi:MAG: tripartite tricarboxylate transporter substrate binding protein [Burkholderiaceae bacterium]|jgi:tripartite-type tricarboxylate transporter receptor subunit TctC|nr:tripartite tricarboxylate transporter substrate binding protein [Burkholderiaceae bacterium]